MITDIRQLPAPKCVLFTRSKCLLTARISHQHSSYKATCTALLTSSQIHNLLSHRCVKYYPGWLILSLSPCVCHTHSAPVPGYHDDSGWHDSHPGTHQRVFWTLLGCSQVVSRTPDGLINSPSVCGEPLESGAGGRRREIVLLQPQAAGASAGWWRWRGWAWPQHSPLIGRVQVTWLSGGLWLVKNQLEAGAWQWAEADEVAQRLVGGHWRSHRGFSEVTQFSLLRLSLSLLLLLHRRLLEAAGKVFKVVHSNISDIRPGPQPRLTGQGLKEVSLKSLWARGRSRGPPHVHRGAHWPQLLCSRFTDQILVRRCLGWSGGSRHGLTWPGPGRRLYWGRGRLWSVLTAQLWNDVN